MTIAFISHGGGPLPLLGDPGHQEMVEHLNYLAQIIQRPKEILVISAHWESNTFTITSGAKPDIIYDYYGFPNESYQLQYPVSGSPDLASQVHSAIKNQALPATLDADRGFDHGLWVPLTLMYPNADIPCVQLSLHESLDPKLHWQLGKALQDLNRPDRLILGSGFSFHNMKGFFEQPSTKAMQDANSSFETWLTETLLTKPLNAEEQQSRLFDWSSAPGARMSHPREEHLIPLHVCFGAAQRSADEHFAVSILNRQSSTFLWH